METHIYLRKGILRKIAIGIAICLCPFWVLIYNICYNINNLFNCIGNWMFEKR